MEPKPRHEVGIVPGSRQLIGADGEVMPLTKPRTPSVRASCTCGWRGAERADGEQAARDGRAHVALFPSNA